VRCHFKLGGKEFGILFFILPRAIMAQSQNRSSPIRHDVFCAAARRIIRHHSFSMTNP
jgi:hypothetical protein